MTAWKRNNANMREFMGRKDDLRKEKRARKRENSEDSENDETENENEKSWKNTRRTEKS